MPGPNWSKVTAAETAKIAEIAKRFEREATELEGRLPRGYQRLNLIMDIEAAHLACPIDLERLLTADSATFGHDLGGISRHINRETGALEGCFVPRTARRSEPAAQPA
jgi:hypothetical protein